MVQVPRRRVDPFVAAETTNFRKIANDVAVCTQSSAWIFADRRDRLAQALFAANPMSDPANRRELTVLEGEVPSPYNPPEGCPFVTRCPIKIERCKFGNPSLVQIGNDHRVTCWQVS